MHSFPCSIRRRQGWHLISRSIFWKCKSSMGVKTPRPGFALPGVLVLTMLISAMVPLMITLNRESVSAARRDQVRVSASAQAHHMFMMAHAYLLMHGGLPVGWHKGNIPDAADIRTDLGYCSGYAGHEGEGWGREDARVVRLTIGEESLDFAGSRAIAGIYAADRGELPYETYIVMGCFITRGAYAQGAALRGEFARSRGRFHLLSLSGDTS
jgi:hypothetical protein